MSYSGNIKKVSFDGSVKPVLYFDQKGTLLKPQRFNQRAKLASMPLDKAVKLAKKKYG